MYIESIIILVVALVSTSIIGKAWESGAFGGNLQRAFAGGSVGYVSNKFLIQYTQFESLLSASFNGSLGFVGYLFIGAISFLILVWISNLIEYRTLVQ